MQRLKGFRMSAMVSMGSPDLFRSQFKSLVMVIASRNSNPHQSINGMPKGIWVVQHRCNSGYNLMVREETSSSLDMNDEECTCGWLMLWLFVNPGK